MRTVGTGSIEGSSPHARGARFVSRGIMDVLGIIPACAGSTYQRYCKWHYRWDHPRMRGEHHTTALRSPHAQGSSPHARGARVGAGQARAVEGIIPACAGSTASAATSDRLARDHPRMRGEHQLVQAMGLGDVGSSPHARGARSSRPTRMVVSRIIPACAGSTGWVARRRPRPRDHPRMRGEHGSTTWGLHTSPGSSPHARGAQADLQGLTKDLGIIPACAGSTRT